MPNSPLLTAAWIFVAILKYGSLLVVLAGIGVFGWNFVRLNAKAGRSESGDVPAAAWKGPAAMLGAKLVGLGIGLAVIAMLAAAVLPGRL
jgi:uncharacterized membrane protein YedE/YeeE